MKGYIKHDEWRISEEGFHPDLQEVSESVFSIGNGYMGQRANFEERYSGQSLQGSYFAGVYYPDKTRVGWWKNGYPATFAKVINSTNWIGIDVTVNGTALDLATCHVREFRRVLDLRDGVLTRTLIATLPDGIKIAVETRRFVSMARPQIGALRYRVTPLAGDATITLTPYLDGDVSNRNSNHGEKFWDEVERFQQPHYALLTVKTNQLDVHVATAMTYQIASDHQLVDTAPTMAERDKYVAQTVTVKACKGAAVTIDKLVAGVTSRDHAPGTLAMTAHDLVCAANAAGFDELLAEQRAAWAAKWRDGDIVIEGDTAAQQGIRYAIFQLNQTYTGQDERLNIGPKGFTGEKYGGGTYWDTEAYCLPFYLATAPSAIARQLLLYRYRHLQKAKDNARQLGISRGALYPMVTMNGEECHNEWEITFEEIHRNAAIAYAIYKYVNDTGDQEYLDDYGLEVLIELSRFWAERVNYSEAKKGFVILGVTGPNEYENNVNNNWYTNRMAAWTLDYTLRVIAELQARAPERWSALSTRILWDEREAERWRQISAGMYYPIDEERRLFLQQDGFLDKEIIPASQLPPEELPLHQHWSWDRILRSCFIKQADVLQGLFFLGDQYDLDTKRRHFDFYEPLTVHESSLSPCVHSILACELGYGDKAYELYLRTARLDLDDYNNDTKDGCHITSMAGTWMALVYGFGGYRVRSGRVCLNPSLPTRWQSYAFKVLFRGARLCVTVRKNGVSISNEAEREIPICVYDRNYTLAGGSVLTIDLETGKERT